MRFQRLIMFMLMFLFGAFQLPLISTQVRADQNKLIYMAVWRGCEDACQGFKDYVSKSGMNAEIIVRNADRDKGKLTSFVKEAKSLDADLVVTWGTSVTLGMAGTLANHNEPRFLGSIPTVFMIVADPVRSNIIESYSKTGRQFVTGTRNRVPEVVNIKAMKTYKPDFKHLGLLYNKNEINSVLKMEEIRDLADKMKFTLTTSELHLGADGKPTLDTLSDQLTEFKAKGVEFVYLGSSSFLRNNGDAFTSAALENGLPILSPYEQLVRNSKALMSISVKYYDVGQLAAEQAEAILFEGEHPGDLPVRAVKNYAYVINMETARKLNMFPSVGILQFAEIVNK